MEAECDDVGIGALFGLYDWRFEVLGLISHALHLQKHYNVGPHTISFPRLRPACGVKIDETHLVSDDDFKRLVAILRLSVPYTGLICTAREPPDLRREILAFGVSQIDAGSRIEIGGYTEAGDAQVDGASSSSNWATSARLDDVVRELLVDGYIPSFCTACYRLGRTGEHFMEFAIPGFIQNFCTPNALSTLMEYLVDYASPETRKAGEAAVRREVEKLPDGDRKRLLLDRLRRIAETEERDLYLLGRPGVYAPGYAVTSPSGLMLRGPTCPFGTDCHGTTPRNRPLGNLRRPGRCSVGNPHVAGDRELPAGRPARASSTGPCLRRRQIGRGSDQP